MDVRIVDITYHFVTLFFAVCWFFFCICLRVRSWLDKMITCDAIWLVETLWRIRSIDCWSDHTSLRYHCMFSASPSDRYSVFGMRNLPTRNMHTTRSSVSCTSIFFHIIFFTLRSSRFFVYALCELHIMHTFLLWISFFSAVITYIPHRTQIRWHCDVRWQ